MRAVSATSSRRAAARRWGFRPKAAPRLLVACVASADHPCVLMSKLSCEIALFGAGRRRLRAGRTRIDNLSEKPATCNAKPATCKTNRVETDASSSSSKQMCRKPSPGFTWPSFFCFLNILEYSHVNTPRQSAPGTCCKPACCRPCEIGVGTAPCCAALR